MSLVINWMNPVSLVGQIVYLCQLYSKDEQEMYNVRDFVHKKKIKSIIIHMLEIIDVILKY